MNEMLVLLSEQMQTRIYAKVHELCIGCLIGMQTMHDICNLPRKAKIEKVFNAVLADLHDEIMKDVLYMRCFEKKLPFTDDMYINKNTLVNNKGFVKKLIVRIEKYI